MASRPTHTGFGLRRVALVSMGLVFFAVTGVLVWIFAIPKPIDYCKNLSESVEFKVTAAFCHMATKAIQLVNDEGKILTIQARIADETEEHQAGFQKIGPGIISGSSIFFVFSQDTIGPFHMCNVEDSLDIIWFRRDGTIIDAKTMTPGGMQPAEECEALTAPAGNGAYLYALETRNGFLKSHNISKDKSRLVPESLRQK